MPDQLSNSPVRLSVIRDLDGRFPRAVASPPRPSAAFWVPLAGVTLLDVATKYLAHVRLRPEYVPRDVLGDTLRWTLLYNPGAAFGLHLGPYSRWIFLAITLVMLGVLWRLYRSTPRHQWVRAVALGLVAGGAAGNFINRIWSERGVVDFIDVGIGASRWPAFNVADIGVTTGAILLALVLHREDQREPRLS